MSLLEKYRLGLELARAPLDLVSGEPRLDVGALRDRGTVLLDGQLQGTVSAWSPATTTRSRT